MATRWPEEEIKNSARAFCLRCAAIAANGGRYEGSPLSLASLLAYAAQVAIANAEWPQAADNLAFLTAVMPREPNWDWHNQYVIQPIIKACKDKSAFEIGYLFLDGLQKRGKLSDALNKQLTVAKAEFGRAIPDISADPSDPLFDLRQASRVLALGNEERAWELTEPKLPQLLKAWMEFDPAYVAWVVEQMRKTKRLKEALQFAFEILIREMELDPEIAARVILTKGDIYANLENYPAARIEYEGLKNNSRYKKTEAGAKAKYRLIQLMIATKDYTKAEELLQMLVDSDNADTRAEAYYLYALMAYD
ncbi:MAG: hypothetical protein N3A66_12300, partial [Planctomycetota bacterium]|nr:hypothetical protein [Planctomycetota bacterium]